MHEDDTRGLVDAFEVIDIGEMEPRAVRFLFGNRAAAEAFMHDCEWPNGSRIEPVKVTVIEYDDIPDHYTANPPADLRRTSNDEKYESHTG